MGFRDMFRNRDFCLSPNYIGVIDVANISELQTLTVCQTIWRHKNIENGGNNWKEFFGNEQESCPPLPPVGYFKFDSDQQTFSNGLFSITALAIMQDFRDNEKKKQLKMTVSQPFWILFLRNLSGVILVSTGGT